MPKVKFHLLIQQIRGKLYDDLLVRLSPQGELILSKRPDMSNVKWSKAQKTYRRRFKQAVADARAALADPATRAKYERLAKKQGKRPWDVALSAYLHEEAVLTR